VAVAEGENLVGWTYFGSSYLSSAWLDTPGSSYMSSSWLDKLWQVLREFWFAEATGVMVSWMDTLLAEATGVMVGWMDTPSAVFRGPRVG
jgi:hypothetical protein